MALNVKNEETQRLARELSERTGETIIAAITEAPRELLDPVQGDRGARLVDRFLTIGKDCKVPLREPYRSGDPVPW